jgi:hypothetical protein
MYVGTLSQNGLSKMVPRLFQPDLVSNALEDQQSTIEHVVTPTFNFLGRVAFG